MDAADTVVNIDVLISSISLNRMPAIAPLIRSTPPETVVIDTANYYPRRDGNIAEIDEGLVESVWIAEQFNRPIAKAWNALTSQSFADKAAPAGAPGRIAIPIAADRQSDRAVAMQLVDETGFDAYDAGAIADSRIGFRGAAISPSN